MLKKIDYIREQDDKGEKLLWIDKEWNSNEFRNYVEHISKSEYEGNFMYDKRNSLIRIKAREQAGIKKDIVIKKFKFTRKYDQLRFCFLKSKAIRSLRMALALEKIKVKTPRPIAVIEKRGSFNQIIYSYFVTEYVDHDYNLLDIVKDYNHPRREQVKSFLPQIARDIRKMHDVGIVHNDLHAGNILVKELDKNPEFYYIDLNRGRIKKELSVKKKVKDLARFKFKKEEQKIFLKNYDPNRYRELLELMIKHRKSRERILKFKRKLEDFFKKFTKKWVD